MWIGISLEISATMKSLFFGCLLVVRTFSTIYIPQSIEIEDCDDDDDTGTGTPVTSPIINVAVASKNILGTSKGDTIIVMAESTASSISKADLCRKTDSSDSNKEYYHVKTSNIKSFLYKVNNAYKFIAVGSDLNSALTPYDIVTAESNGKLVFVDYVKCLKSSGLEEFKQKYADNTPKPYIEDSTRICFVPFLMIEPILVTATGSASYSITVTPFQKHDCPKCQEIPTPSSCPKN